MSSTGKFRAGDDDHWVKLGSLVLFLVVLISFLIYWKFVELRFIIGDALPGQVITINPVRVAVLTDLSMSGDVSYPVLKIVKVPLKVSTGVPIYLGQRLVMVATYLRPLSGDKWFTVFAVPLKTGTEDSDRVLQLLKNFEEDEWTALQNALDEVQTTKPGLFRLRQPMANV